jgi:hypothetical protein
LIGGGPLGYFESFGRLRRRLRERFDRRGLFTLIISADKAELAQTFDHLLRRLGAGRLVALQPDEQESWDIA